jgi:sugar lactone lactonase YvrE
MILCAALAAALALQTTGRAPVDADGPADTPATTQPAAEQRAMLPGDFDGQLAVAQGGPAVGVRDERLQPIVLIEGAMPTTFDVGPDGTIYSAFPRWRDPVNYTVAKIDPKTGTLTPFPDARTNAYEPGNAQEFDPTERFVCVQAVHLDTRGRLWVLDTGAVNMGSVVPGGAKLWAYDPQTGQRLVAITFDIGAGKAVLPTTYLNDVRFDLDLGDAGTAFITDSNEGAIIVVDLATGDARRELDEDRSTAASQVVTLNVEGQPLMVRPPEGEPKPLLIAADGIAISDPQGEDGRTVFFTPLTSRTMFRHNATELGQNLHGDTRGGGGGGGGGFGASIAVLSGQRHANMASANDGIFYHDGGIYTTDFEDNAIRRIDTQTGEETLIVQDERLLWPDCVVIRDGTLYVSSNQLHRQPQFHRGEDLRQPPYVFFAMDLKDE